MAIQPLITGQMRQGDEPDWLALERVLGSDDLCGYFMWMFDVELDDGTILNAYKHRFTRQYMHLAADERAFWYAGTELYHEVDLRTAIDVAFTPRSCAELGDAETVALNKALRRAQEAAL